MIVSHGIAQLGKCCQLSLLGSWEDFQLSRLGLQSHFRRHYQRNTNKQETILNIAKNTREVCMKGVCIYQILTIISWQIITVILCKIHPVQHLNFTEALPLMHYKEEQSQCPWISFTSSTDLKSSSPFFTDSALWVGSVIELRCPSECMFVNKKSASVKRVSVFCMQDFH